MDVDVVRVCQRLALTLGLRLYVCEKAKAIRPVIKVAKDNLIFTRELRSLKVF